MLELLRSVAVWLAGIFDGGKYVPVEQDTALTKRPTKPAVDAARLSPNFTLAELTRSDTAQRLRLGNSPDDEQLANLRKLAQALEQVRRLCGDRPVRISSGFRSAAVNRAVGGSATSDHMSGLSVDFVVSGMSVREVCERIARSNMKFDQLIYEQGNTKWAHLGMGPRMRREVLSWRSGRGYVTGVVDL